MGIYDLKICLPRSTPFLVRLTSEFLLVIDIDTILSRAHIVCLHTAARSGATVVGLPPGIWCSSQRALRNCAAITYAR